MALSILDGNQSATTLSTIVTSGQHIPAHTVVSLGTQAISNITSAVSGSSITFGLVGGTVTANNFTLTNVLQYDGSHYFLKVGGVATTGGTSFPVYVAGSVTANPTGTQTIAGSVTANVPNIQVCTQGNSAQTSAIQTALGVINENNNSQVLAVFGGEAVEGEGASAFVQVRNQISGTVTIGSALPAGTNRIGVVTIGAGTVTIGAGTAQIGSVTASISNSVVTFYPLQGTAVTNSNFTSTTASTTLVSAVSGREVLTVFNEGAGNLHISPGATCTTVAYQVRLSAGDYWECPAGQLSLAHTAVFSTAGTARVTEVS